MSLFGGTFGKGEAGGFYGYIRLIDNYREEPLPTANGLEEIAIGFSRVATNCYKNTSPEQTAWDKINRLEENLKYYEENLIKQSEPQQAIKNLKCSMMLSLSLEMRFSDVLYGKIKDRFVKLCRQLHRDNEEDFDAILPQTCGS